MSDIRTHDQLQEAMASDFAWRKKELHGLKTLVIANKDTHRCDLFVRAAITLLYAHWEGFIKHIGSAYLQFVARQQLKHEELPSNFLAMAISRLVQDSANNNRIRACVDIVHFFRSKGASRSNLKWKSGVNTKSNLKSEVFREIVECLGLDYSRFATKEKLLDEQLLNHRNKIAHGQYLPVSFDEYIDLHDEVFGIMQDFYNQVENAALLGKYKC